MDEPQRTCIVTRTAQPASALIRFVLDPEGAVVPDTRRRLPGRGVWVSADADSVNAAVRRNLFTRGFRQTVSVAPDLAERVDRLLEQEALSSLSLARKAGVAVNGFEKVRSCLLGGGCAVLIAAREGAVDGRRRLSALAAEAGRSDNAVPVINVFGAEALSAALGHGHVIHAALRHAGIAEIFRERADRLERFRRPVECRGSCKDDALPREDDDRTNVEAFAG